MSRLTIQPEVEDTTIVFLGSFGPDQFQPHWFSANDLIGEAEAKQAQIDVVSRVATRFRITTNDITVMVEENRFSVSAPVFVESAFDLILNTFERVLPGQNISALGINRTVHFDAGSNDSRTRVGKRLAPPQEWGSLGDLILKDNESGDPTKTGGMVSLSMRRTRSDSSGSVTARIEPSVRLPFTGIFLSINDHFDIKDSMNAKAACFMLREQWEGSRGLAHSIIEHIMVMCKEERRL
ncbi:hypothetical protein [Reyranella massiliensis]|uniref:hypothetical protein n=1 Tax=Reyranella massiliensis TaxID=445220 RepID=UPI0005C28583|nr:hypothetical protein [Reyranella massiliensis]